MDNKATTLEKIADLYYDEIFKYCKRRVKTDDAYDITQEIFLALSVSVVGINLQSVRKWLYTTAHNKIVDYYKRNKIETDNRAYIDISDETFTLYEDFTENLDENDLTTYKSGIMKSLSKDEFSLYRNIFIEKKNVSMLVSEFGISEAAMRKRILRLNNKIRKLIKSLLYFMFSFLTS